MSIRLYQPYEEEDEFPARTWLGQFVDLNTLLDYHPLVGKASKPCGNPGAVGRALAYQWFSLSSN
jgi:hypothetical protein